ncbi:MAG: sensor hybrid histidine kinase [Rhizobacter sp.]|nr:sensor hybrid histidine kinase [Rhizobacter sp.]
MKFLVETRAQPAAGKASRLVVMVLASVCILAVAAWSIVASFRTERQEAAMRLHSITYLRAEQVQAWIDRRDDFANLLKESTYLATLFARWRLHGDADAGTEFVFRVGGIRTSGDNDGALVLDDHGTLLAELPPPNPATGPAVVHESLRSAVERAWELGRPVHTSIYRSDPNGPLRMDIVVPLTQSTTQARGTIVLRVDPQRWLYPTLNVWPVPSRTAETVLWDAGGGRLANISELQQAHGTTREIDQPLATSSLLVARYARGEADPQSIMRSADETTGHEVIAASRRVDGTDWWLISRIDLAEVDAPAWQNARLAMIAAACALLVTWVLGLLWAQRRHVEWVRQQATNQQDRLQTLALLQSIAHCSAEAIFAKDLDGRFIFCNRVAGEVAGLTPERMLGLTNVQIFDEVLAARLTATELVAVAGGVPVQMEETITSSAGTSIRVTTKGPLFDGNGRLIGMLGVSRDITETRLAQQALLDSEAKSRAVVSSLTEGVVLTDLNGRVVSANPSAARLLGMSVRALEGDDFAKGWTALRHDGSAVERRDLPTGRVLSSQSGEFGVLVRATGPSGAAAVFLVNAVPVRTEDTGEMVGVVTSFSDVTARIELDGELERHRSELERRVKERTLQLTTLNASLERIAQFNRSLSNATPGAVTYWDHENRCRYANRTFLEWIDQHPEQVLGHTKREIFGAMQFLEDHWRVPLALGGTPQRFEIELVTEASGLRICEVHYAPARSGTGPAHGVYMMAFDITALKLAEARLTDANEQLLRARDQAEAATRAKSEFLANMSHEIRTPLNAVLGLSHLLSRDPRDALQKERLRHISDAGKHLLEIINNVLDLSKIEAGKMELEQTDFLVEPVLAQVCAVVSERARAKRVEVLLDIADIPGTLRGDPTRLAQMVLNLLSNAVKFTHVGYVRVRATLLGEDERRLQLRFEVEDTGEGMSDEAQRHLFTAFEQGDSTTTRRHGGTGLGLSLTRQLATAMHGEVGVSSRLGQGSTFWFTAELARPLHPVIDATPPAPTGPLRVLVVDDVEAARDLLEVHLSAMGLQVDSVDGGEAAVGRIGAEMVAGRPYDLVLIDWRMNGINGVQTLDRMRALMGNGMPPAVLMSAADEAALREQADTAWFDASLAKPITASSLRACIARVMRRDADAEASSIEVADLGEAMVAQRHGGQRVLLVEDNLVNQRVARDLLACAGLVVEVADNGAAAVELAMSRHFDLIAMDVQMPVMDGLEAARTIRAGIGAKPPIVAMTANAFVENRAECLAAGMDAHLSKPIDPAVLYATLLRWLPARRVEAAAARLERGVAMHEASGSEVRACIERIEGLDVEVGVRNMGGRFEMLVRALDIFRGVYRAGVPDLVQTSPVEMRELWLSECHSLRGACLTLGARDLVQEIRSLEDDLKRPATGEELRVSGAALATHVLDLVGALDEALGLGPEQASSEVH